MSRARDLSDLPAGSGNLNVDGTVTADGLTVGSSTLTENASDLIIDAADDLFLRANGQDAIRIFQDASSLQNVGFRNTSQDGSTFLVSGNGDISFYEDTGTTPKFFWDASAERLGIGDTTPDAALDVVGNIHYTGTITDVSDRRLKENVTDLTGSLEKICQLSGKSYTLIADRGSEESVPELGFIAQEVQQIFPDITRVVQKFATDAEGNETEEEVNYIGVSYIQLIAPMVEAIKELKNELDTVKAELQTLKETNQ